MFAAGSALMNYAAADVTSPRSVAAYCMPPVSLAIVVDRCVAATRRHVLGMRDGRSPWAVVGTAAGRGAPVRRAVGAVRAAVPGRPRRHVRGIRGGHPERHAAAAAAAAAAGDERQDDGAGGRAASRREPAAAHGTGRARRASKKTARLDLYRQHEGYGDRARVSPIAAELAPEAGLQAGHGAHLPVRALARAGRRDEAPSSSPTPGSWASSSWPPCWRWRSCTGRSSPAATSRGSAWPRCGRGCGCGCTRAAGS